MWLILLSGLIHSLTREPIHHAQSESLHREAYNVMFREFEIGYHWDEEYYDKLQNKIGG